MTYAETIMQLANNLLVSFDEVYHSAEIISNDKNERFPAITQGDEWIDLSPSDQREIIYIRRNGGDEVAEEFKLSSCVKSYKMRSNLRIVYFKDHANNSEEVLFKLMQAILINGTKLKTINRDKFKLLKEETSGKYNLGANTAYFAIDIYALWDLVPDTCDQDFCANIDNPLKKELCLVAAVES
jgi:hypothetical protein